MFLHSFLGILTLQIGVAVLAACFVTLPFCIVISNFMGVVYWEDDTTSTAYIVLGVMVGLQLLAGFIMLLTAYKESKYICILALIITVVILVFFITTSIMSLSNHPKNVCVYHRHCPESLWMTGLRYRKLPFEDDKDDIQSTTEKEEEEEEVEKEDKTSIEIITTEITTEITTAIASTAEEIYTTTVNTNEALKNRKHSKFQKRPKDFLFQKRYIKTNSNMSDNDKKTSPIDKSVQLPLNSTSLNSTLFSYYKDNGVLSIVKRGVYPIDNYVNDKPSKRKHEHIQKRNTDSNQTKTDDADTTTDDTTTDDPTETTTESIDKEINEVYKYIFGFDLFVAVSLFIIITIILVFTIFVLLSYRKELKYLK